MLKDRATSVEEWESVKVGQVSTVSNWTNTDCQPFENVSHTAHVEQALDIIRDGYIDARLVFDESLLNASRTTVCWLSPNTWTDGSRYGNVRFWFDFRNLLTDKSAYWVENMDYGIRAPRILLSSRAEQSVGLAKYNPDVDQGPWVVINGTPHRNGDVTLEFMIDERIDLSRASSVDFTNHHPRWCNRHRRSPRDCPDLGLATSRGENYFLAGLIVRGLKGANTLLAPDGAPSEALSEAFKYLTYRLGFADEHGSEIGADAPFALELTMAAIQALYHRNEEAFKSRMLRFSRVDAETVLSRVVSSHFNLKELISGT